LALAQKRTYVVSNFSKYKVIASSASRHEPSTENESGTETEPGLDAEFFYVTLQVKGKPKSSQDSFLISLSKRIDSTLSGLTGYTASELSKSRKKTTKLKKQPVGSLKEEILSIPIYSTLAYNVFATPSLFSLRWDYYESACCGGNGSETICRVINADLTAGRYFHLKDFLRPELREQIERLVQDSATGPGPQRDSVQLDFETLENFTFNDSGLFIYAYSGDGAHSWYNTYEFSFDTQPEFFQPGIINYIRRKSLKK